MEHTHRIVVALGGNALGETPASQIDVLRGVSRSLVDLVEQGNDVVVTHGNGPQVGMIKVATDYSARTSGETPEIPFPECGAMSQGYIGYQLVQAVDNEMAARGIGSRAVGVLTQTIVDQDDPSFQNPSKPVGAFLSENEAARKREQTGNVYVEDAGRGWRWVVPSPQPKEIAESGIVRTLVDQDVVVVASGGGGIPVVKSPNGLRGVPAVVDKDRSAALLAREVGADTLLILTAVDAVALDFNTDHQRSVDRMSVEEARRHMAEGQFAPGSMLPKVEACVDFVDSGEGRAAIITSPSHAAEALLGRAGTRIVR